MPPFSFLKSQKAEMGAENVKPEAEAHVEPQTDNSEKAERRQSKREYFRNLLKRSSFSTHSKAEKRKGQHFGKPAQAQPITDPPTSPKNKPLPPPPPRSDNESNTPPTNIGKTLQLQRIISPLSVDELHKLFSGAPQFFCRSEGHHTGAPHPSVAFPWDLEVRLRDLRDYIRIQDEAWGCVTAWPHMTAQVYRNAEATKEATRTQRAHFLPRCRERPNMLSMQGLERGSVGYQAALERDAADALAMPDEAEGETLAESRRQFLKGKDGLRPVSEVLLVEKLVAVGETYQEDPLKHRKPTVQLYTELFTQLLFPPSRVIDSRDPYSLEVQIESLVQILAAPVVWVDFGLVEWRIRLGQMLWGSEMDDDIAVNEEEPKDGLGSQKYWLLLQILLACELLIRLDAISMNIDHGLEAPKPAEIRRFEKDATTSVKWSLHLARAWLDNIQVDKPDAEAPTEKKPAGWLATLTGTAESTPATSDFLSTLRFHGKNQTRQLHGLIHFARRIQWPNIDTLESKATANGICISAVPESTTATPLSIATNRSSSYFKHKPHLRRGLSLHKNISAIIHPGGWLSNSYLSGLILPGEGLSHFLMSTLLENDSDAVARLGDQANLYGGFIYLDRSFWSTACVVGRVLAAKAKATECMGWVSSDVVPRGAGEGWVDIDVELPPQLPKDTKPRIYHKTLIETDGHILGATDPSSILPGDFIMPADDFGPQPMEIRFEGLDLFASVESVESTPMASPVTLASEVSLRKIGTYSAMMRFTVGGEEGGKERELSFSLSHDVAFVTAHPCVLDECTRELIKEKLGEEEGRKCVGHPLHKAHTYTTLPLSAVLLTPSSTPLSSLLSSSNTSSTPNVLLIDATTSSQATTSKTTGIKRSQFGSDREMLVRALCAERGWNALISRRGRSCVGCCVRECGSLGGIRKEKKKGGCNGDWVVVRVA